MKESNITHYLSYAYDYFVDLLEAEGLEVNDLLSEINSNYEHDTAYRVPISYLLDEEENANSD